MLGVKFNQCLHPKNFTGRYCTMGSSIKTDKTHLNPSKSISL